MLKQNNITFFIFLSIALHALVLSKYTLQSPVQISSLNKTFSIELSSFVVPAQQSAVHKPVQPDQQQQTIRSQNNFSATSQSEPLPVKETVAKNDSADVTPDDMMLADANKEAQQVQQPSTSSDKKNQYLSDLLSQIEQNKFYPTAARRRDMQETIQVSFYLLADGNIDRLEINGRYKPLITAAKSAVISAMPFNHPPADIVTPLKIQYAMAFQLN